MNLFHCCLLHKWGKWEDKQSLNVTHKDKGLVGHVILQERRCECCGKLERQAHRVWVL